MASEMMTAMGTCIFFGGEDHPWNPSTLYRNIQLGLVPKPVHVGPNTARWIRSECAEAKKKMMEARDNGTAPYYRVRGRGLNAKKAKETKAAHAAKPQPEAA